MGGYSHGRGIKSWVTNGVVLDVTFGTVGDILEEYFLLSIF
jgi:hypothetical protein